MPIWLTIVLACGGSAIITFLVNRFGDSIITAISKHARNKKERKEAEARDKRIAEIKEANKPLEDKVDLLQAELIADKEAVVASLRTDMMLLRDQFRAQKYASRNDKAAWIQLYNDYTKLGGNHFKEYVDSWKEEVEGFPTQKPKKALNKTTKKDR